MAEHTIVEAFLRLLRPTLLLLLLKFKFGEGDSLGRIDRGNANVLPKKYHCQY